MQLPAPITAPNECFPNSSPSSSVCQKEPQHQEEELKALAAPGLPICVGCEPTLDGVLSATGLIYLARLSHAEVRFVRDDLAQPSLAEVYFHATTIHPLAERVFLGFQRHLEEEGLKEKHRRRTFGTSQKCTHHILYMSASDDKDMPQALFSYLKAGFSHGSRITSLNSSPWIARAEELATAVSNECERARQFVRFSRMEGGYYGAVYRPKANVIPLVAAHFSQRMAPERFALLDPVHGVLVLGDRGITGMSKLTCHEAEQLATLQRKDPAEPFIQALWKGFYDALALPQRGITERGYDLRSQLMPKRLWDGLPELNPAVDGSWTIVPSSYTSHQNTPSLTEGVPSLPEQRKRN